MPQALHIHEGKQQAIRGARYRPLTLKVRKQGPVHTIWADNPICLTSVPAEQLQETVLFTRNMFKNSLRNRVEQFRSLQCKDCVDSFTSQVGARRAAERLSNFRDGRHEAKATTDHARARPRDERLGLQRSPCRNCRTCFTAIVQFVDPL